ncbi:MAG: branched-chain amino acid ABC transporter permease [Coriobacteriia bacterium]|nr:branched-chain amino acid ABC transporter permease [Coriobacteriia bacterium]MCL2870200.1 branched-chain amino acid ABC transporter permease [Coriobacteriia bacterium]
MEFFVQLLIDGLTLGGMYALIALGFTLVYGILLMINFAHAEMFMTGGFIGYGVLNLLGSESTIATVSDTLPFMSFLQSTQPFFTTTAVGFILMMLLTFGISAVLTGLLGITIERFAYRPLRNSPRLCALISALGMSLFLQNFVLLAVGHRMVFPTPEFLANLDAVPLFGAIRIAPIDLIIFITCLVLLFTLDRFVSKTKLGKAMRATSQDKDAAGLMGININSVIALTFFIGPALGAVAGTFFGLKYGVVTFNMGLFPGIKAFTAAVLGGIGNLRGAMLGGFLIGVLEALASGYISIAYRDVITFAILILILIFRPGGLLGESVVEKV